MSIFNDIIYIKLKLIDFTYKLSFMKTLYIVQSIFNTQFFLRCVHERRLESKIVFLSHVYWLTLLLEFSISCKSQPGQCLTLSDVNPTRRVVKPVSGVFYLL